MQKPKSAPVRRFLLFLGLPIIPTIVNDMFIQPYTSNKTYLRWNRLKNLISFLQVLWFLVDWRPLPGTNLPGALFFNQIRVPPPP